jgi:hypothetical protein
VHEQSIEISNDMPFQLCPIPSPPRGRRSLGFRVSGFRGNLSRGITGFYRSFYTNSRHQQIPMASSKFQVHKNTSEKLPENVKNMKKSFLLILCVCNFPHYSINAFS